jgi:ATP-dependent Zn protease
MNDTVYPELRKIIEEEYRHIATLLGKNREILDRLSHALIEKNRLTREDIEKIVHKTF